MATTKVDIEEIKEKTDKAIEDLRKASTEITENTTTKLENSENNDFVADEFIGCDCEDLDEELEDTDEEVTLEEDLDLEDVDEESTPAANFEDVVSEAQKYVNQKIDEFPTDELKESAKKAARNVKGGLADHGIDTDVLGSKLQEDAANFLSGVLGAVAAGASAIAKMAKDASDNLKADENLPEEVIDIDGVEDQAK